MGRIVEVSGREVVEYMARVRKQEATVVNVRLPDWMVNRLDGKCAVMLLSRSDVIRMALREYLGYDDREVVKGSEGELS